MKQLFFLIIMSIATLCVNAQCTTERLPNGDEMISVSLGNLLLFHNMTHSAFNKTMIGFNYKQTGDGFYRFEGGGPGSKWNEISKDVNKTSILWTYDDDYTISKLKDDLQPFYEGSNEGYHYYVLSDYTKRSYKVTLSSRFVGIETLN